MPEFLAENNSCGQSILQLVSRGNAILAELLRLKDYIPNVFRLENKQDVQKYGDIILDFSYFRVAEAQENKIENNDVLRDIDDEFKENHLAIITRFYSVFEGIHTYVMDLNHFLEELDEGMYIHQTLETVFSDVEGKQLLCEALYLYGLMLLLVDAHFEGIIRERILVAYYRYTPQRSDTQSCIDEVCKLLRDTGLSSNKKPINYPEDYFRRVTIKANYIDVVIGRLRSDDIYDQLSVYPMSQHRSTALANQAAMLYICLFFSTNILHSQTSIMREIVDKYFPDNWIISIYMGHIVNLIETWDSFRAAKQALNNTLETINVKNSAIAYGSNIPELLQTSGLFLKAGIVTNETLLRDINKIVNLLRNCNVSLRWLILHTTTKLNKIERNKKSKQIRDLVILESKYDKVNLFKLLLNTAQFELLIKEMYKNLLAEKEKKWDELKQENYNSLIELSEVFGGSKPLTRIAKNVNLQRWFMEIAKQIDSLEKDNSASSRKIVQLIQALEEVREFHQLDSNMQVIQFLTETCSHLHQMIRNMNIREDVLITLQIIGDLSYAWELIDYFTPIMQLGIKREPTIVIKLRAIFLKLASALETPLLRINQAQSEDLLSVSQYYSSELEIYVRKVVQIIPEMMFQKLARIIEMQTSVLKELPTRLDKDKMKEYAQLNERFEFAELTHSVSVFSEGMRMMKSTLVGVICLDPKKLLEDGIRKELVQHIAIALHNGLTFSAKMKSGELEQNILSLGKIMDGYKRSFEYIQDYININGLKIWQEEVTRIINFNVEQECNGFLRNKVHSWESAYQNRHVPIPYYVPSDNISENFIGRLAREIIRLTDPKNTIYIHQTSTWYNGKTHKPVLNKQNFSEICKAIEVTGLVGLDRLFSFMIVSNLKRINGFLNNKESKSNAKYSILVNAINEIEAQTDVSSTPKFYQNCINRTTKIWSTFLDCVLTVGQLQLIRNLISFTLNLSAKFNARNLESSLSTLNKALLRDVEKNEEKLPSEELMYKLSQCFDYTGMNNPFGKVYVTANTRADYAIVLFLFVLAHLPKLFILRCPANIAKRNQDQIDGASFTIGVSTVFRQFHENLNDTFINLLGKYCKDVGRFYFGAKNAAELHGDIVMCMKFLDTYTTHSKKSEEALRKYLPEEVFHMFQNLAPDV